MNTILLVISGAVMLYTGVILPGPEALAALHLVLGCFFIIMAVIDILEKRHTRTGEMTVADLICALEQQRPNNTVLVVDAYGLLRNRLAVIDRSPLTIIECWIK